MKLVKRKNLIVYLFIVLLFIKLMFMGIFSSEYQDLLFIPFVKYFVSTGDNPWHWVMTTNSNVEFPYHPFMLYFYGVGMLLINVFHIKYVFFQNLIFKIPTIFADIGIFYILLKMFRNKGVEVFWYYFASPVIFYAAYMHSQLDLLPVCFLFLAMYYLKKTKIFQASFVFAIACLFKANSILLLPILLIYILKNYNKRKTCLSFVMILSVYILGSLPYLFSEAYRKLVLFNSKQNLLFDLAINLNSIKIYIPLLILILIYLRFFAYKKINTDLLDSYCVLTVSVFLIFLQPASPAWYIWLIPFLSLFILKFNNKSEYIKFIFWAFNLIYLGYFIFLHVGEYGDLSIFQNPINLKINNEFLQNFIFTFLEAVLFGIVYLICKIGVKSNSVYKKDKGIIIGIGGDSGSGKSTLLEDINCILGENMVFLEGDCTHKWERGDKNWENFTHLDPKANSLHEFVNDLSKLKNFKSIQYKEYNHNTGKFNPPVQIEPKTFIVLSGLHTFYLPKIRKITDIKVYLNPDEELRRYWKIQRDVKQRGYDEKSVLQAMRKREKDSQKYILPQKNFADLIISYFINNKKQSKNNIELNLKIELDSSIYLDDLIHFLNINNIDFIWDYSDNLKTQYIILNNDIKNIDWHDFIIEKIENVEEILWKESIIKTGLRGFIQFVLLRIISEKMKDEYDKRYFD